MHQAISFLGVTIVRNLMCMLLSFHDTASILKIVMSTMMTIKMNKSSLIWTHHGVRVDMALHHLHSGWLSNKSMLSLYRKKG